MCIYYFNFADRKNPAYTCKSDVMSARCTILNSDYYLLEMDFFDGHKETVKLESFQSFTMDNNDVL